MSQITSKNRFKRSLLAAVFSASAVLGTAAAGDAEGRYAVKGIGLMPCGQFIEMAQAGEPQAALVMSWVAGYLSAANMVLPETYDLVTWQEGLLPNIIASACQQVPDQPVAIAASELLAVLGPGRLQKAEAPEQIAVGELRRLLYPSTVRQLQQALKDAGQSVTVDGDFGPGTQTAISAYQKARGLKTSGFPDEPTLVALFTGQGPGSAPARSPAPAQTAPAATPPALMAPIPGPFSKPNQ
ncbi:MAG: peptidoglycan-binding domain-containing protein [Pseudomonadota bacterium]